MILCCKQFCTISATAVFCAQGHYAFVLYDGDRKCALAARDPSGQEELYYREQVHTKGRIVFLCGGGAGGKGEAGACKGRGQ